MKITACPKCGSQNIFQGTMGDGVLTGYTSTDVCKDCGYKGQPIIFDSEKEYKRFLGAVKHIAQGKEIESNEKNSVEDQVDDIINVPKKDKEVVKLLKEYEKEKCSKPIWSKKKGWWPEIILSIVFSSWLYFFTIRPNTSYMNIEMSIIYGVIYIISSFVIFLLFIMFIEYMLRTILGICTNEKIGKN